MDKFFKEGDTMEWQAWEKCTRKCWEIEQEYAREVVATILKKLNLKINADDFNFTVNPNGTVTAERRRYADINIDRIIVQVGLGKTKVTVCFSV